MEELAWGSRNSEQGEKSDVFWIAHWGWSKEPSTQKQKAVAPEIYTQDQGKNQGLVKFPISVTGLKSYKSSAEWMNECDSEVPRDRYREPTSEHVTCKSVMKYTNYTSDRKTSGVKAKFKVLLPLLENWYWHFQSILPNLVSAHRVRLILRIFLLQCTFRSSRAAIPKVIHLVQARTKLWEGRAQIHF